MKAIYNEWSRLAGYPGGLLVGTRPSGGAFGQSKGQKNLNVKNNKRWFKKK